ncbi:MAG: fumarate hydratase [Oscillospiraceae bacterium]|jgi:fumarate hydratase subunit alpha|nr:fumarate hydratase [Oscillospiraceae bacterium]
MRTIQAEDITRSVAELCIKANKVLPCDIKKRMRHARETEPAGLGREIMGDLIKNYELAETLDIPVCQDTGMAVVFIDLGQDVHIEGGGLNEAVDAGVATGYTGGFLRCSVVSDPLRRVNTDDNTPAVIHTRIVPGESLTITVAPKGAGSENMSSIAMMTPAAKEEDIIAYVRDCVKKAGSNPCPPVVVGVGIGGNFEGCALLAKKALCRDTDIPHADPFYAALEKAILEAVNATGVGPQGFGGKNTALAVNIETGATHIASLPVAVNMGCHVTRHGRITL